MGYSLLFGLDGCR